MKKNIHPAYVETEVYLHLRQHVHHPQHRDRGRHSASRPAPACHPFYTGKQKILDTGGRVARFEKRYGKK